MASFLSVSGDTLTYEGREFVLKGFNLEIYAGSDNSIWPGYHGDKARIERLIDAARNPMGANTIRVVFPMDSVATDGNGEVLPDELDKLAHFLRLLSDRGMGAIVTMFNREDYTDRSRRERDKAKVWSFLRRFGQDPRIFLWDLVNEPPLGGPDQLAVLEWVNDLTNRFRAFRDSQGRPPAQPLTIGVDWHHALEVADPGRNLQSVLALSDVISIHCYGRFAEGYTPTDDKYGVKYKDEKFLGGVLHWIREAARDQARNKPILLEEFGWPNHHTLCWPPGEDPDCKETKDEPPNQPPPGAHKWRVYSFPRTAESMDQLYAEMLGVIDRDNPNPPNPRFEKVAGAIQWTLQDAPENPHHHFGIMTTAETFKRTPIFEGAGSRAAGTTSPSATEAFANWGAGHVWHIPIPPAADAAFVRQTVPTEMEGGRRYLVTVVMRNTGTDSWRPGRYSLGSQEPVDNRNWGMNRVTVPTEIFPGAEAEFTFEATAPMILDEPVTFRWKMVRENVGWFGERNQHVAVTVVKDARFVGQVVPAAMVAGTSQEVSITMRNISGAEWTSAAGFKLGSQNPQDNATWGRSRIELPGPVPHGAAVTFRFPVQAPATVGHHNFQWRMLREGVAWIGQRTKNVEMRTMPPLTKAAVFVAQSVPNPMSPASTQTVSVTMRNVGTATWKPGEGYSLGSQNPMNNTRWGTNRVPLPHEVPPNGLVTFTFPVLTHPTEGFMNFQWQLAQDGAGWFGQITHNVEVRIAWPLRGALFVRQTVPSSMTLGVPPMASITMRNTGQETWTPAGLYRLGSQNPPNNGSWGTNRVFVPHDVPPNTEVTFTFPMAATTRRSEKNFQWRMVLDGVAWFGQTTPNVVVRVR